MTSVLVDGHVLWTEARWHGFGRYLSDLIEALAKLEGMDLVVATGPGVRLPTNVSRVGVLRCMPHRFRVAERDLSLWYLRHRVSTDLLHCPAFGALRSADRPWVQTVHDLIPMQFDHPNFVIERPAWRNYIERIAGADRIITGSNAVAKDLVEVAHIPWDRIDVVPHGVHKRFAPGPATATGAPYVVQLGVGPHKGLSLATGAIDEAAAAGLPHRLVVTGRVPSSYEYLIDEARAAMRHPERLEMAGHVDDDALVHILRAATAMLVTSDAEGFGLPALEGMATGVPVLATRTGAVAEVVDDAALVVEHGRVDLLADALVALLRGEVDREQLIRRGIARAAEFTWQRCAQRTREVYEASLR